MSKQIMVRLSEDNLSYLDSIGLAMGDVVVRNAAFNLIISDHKNLNQLAALRKELAELVKLNNELKSQVICGVVEREG